MNNAEHEIDNEHEHAARSAVIIEAIARRLPDTAGLTLLDYGCGTGPVGLGLASRFSRTILVDNDSEALAEATAAATTVPGAETRLLDLTQEVPHDLRVDVVVSAMSWHHVRDLGTLLDALAHVAPGGRLFVADLDADGGAYHSGQPDFHGHHGFVRADLIDLVARHGYTDISVTDLWQGHRWISDDPVPASVFLLQATVPSRT
ncbi:MAG: class I SAM-dependent methyltransferase [Propionibacteriaceae bacterium]|nr:class I SAM-dependent methyltransferase [Propionibacteriaceae bacterium]